MNYYSLVPLIALIILCITNFDVFFDKRYQLADKKVLLTYQLFIISVALFYMNDLVWGFVDPLPDKTIASSITSIFFLFMGVCVLAWTYFATTYIPYNKVFNWTLRITGIGFLITMFVLLAINSFNPILFSYYGSYETRPARNGMYGFQAVVFFLISVYAFITLLRKRGQRSAQYLTLATFGLVMGLFISGQIYLPLYPMYSLGLSVGTILVHTFIVGSYRDRMRQALTDSKNREERQIKEINQTRALAYIDPLTKVKNKHAYVELESNFDTLIHDDKLDNFSVFIFDLNDLKLINDTYGHETGDKYIIKSCKLIAKHFPGSEIYRFGGDEFITILQKEEFDNRLKYLDSFNAEIEKNIKNDEPVIAVGYSDYIRHKDNSFRTIFLRADEKMYVRKRFLKNLQHDGVTEGSNKSTGMKLSTLRHEMYEVFYHSSAISLLDMLNSSNCDEILEADIETDTFKQIAHIDGKYFIPLINLSYKELIDFTYLHIVHPDDRELYHSFMNIDGFFERLKNASIPNFDFCHFRYKLQDGTYRYVEQVVIAGKEFDLPDNKLRIYVFDINNIKTRHLGDAESNNVSIIGRDTITGLYSSKEFFTNAEVIATKNSDREYCLITLDIEHFKLFDEWFGREKGDYLLAKIGEALRNEEEKGDFVAGYFGSDDFTVLCENKIEIVQYLYDKIHSIINSFGLSTGFLPAFGVAVIEKNMAIVDAFDRATIAASKAKNDICNRIVIYNEEMRYQVDNEIRILTDFMHALQNDEITFYLQPQCRISTGHIVGVEALARWIKKDGTVIPPGDFVPVLEKYGFITDLDKYMWEKVCLSLRDWLDSGKEAVPVSLNVSRIDIFNIDIEQYFVDLCKKYNIDHHYIKIEITESAYAEAMNVVDELVNKLRARGFVVLMDDFGSGYSSLNMLSNLKLDAIKLDAMFLNFEDKDASSSRAIHILESVINMAKTMAIPIIVEGVETKKQVEFLEELGVRYVQGYYFYKPMPVNEFRHVIQDGKNVDKRGFVAKLNEQFRIREFLDKNIYTDSMLNSILGSVAIYSVSGDKIDIIRYNQQFYESVNVPDFVDRLENIEQFVPINDRPALYKALKDAKEDKYNGASVVTRFLRTDGLYASFRMHFYYLGLKEGTDRYYGSATNVTELSDLVEIKKLVAEYSNDNLICVSRVNNQWKYTVISHYLSDVIGLKPAELEEELNNGKFAHRVTPAKDLKNFMAHVEERFKSKENNKKFTTEFTIVTNSHKKIRIRINAEYVGDTNVNVSYVLKTELVNEE